MVIWYVTPVVCDSVVDYVNEDVLFPSSLTAILTDFSGSSEVIGGQSVKENSLRYGEADRTA
jgi:hypothetical protein